VRALAIFSIQNRPACAQGERRHQNGASSSHEKPGPLSFSGVKRDVQHLLGLGFERSGLFRANVASQLQKLREALRPLTAPI